MDELSALFFEDPFEDGIQLVADDDISSLSDQPRESFQEEQGALLSVGALGLGEDEPDGNASKSLHQLIKKRNLRPSELKEGLGENWSEWAVQVNEVDQSTGLAPIHYISLYYVDTYTTLLLLNLLTYGNADIDARAADGKTALMLAVQARNIRLVKVLVALGANVNIGCEGATPLRMAMEMSGNLEKSTDNEDQNDPRGFEETFHGEGVDDSASPSKDPQDMVHVLRSVGATTHYREMQQQSESAGDARMGRAELDTYKVAKVYTELNESMIAKKAAYLRNPSPSVACEAMEALARVEGYRREHGSRILCLDGGGVKGLVQIQMLRQIEQRTGKRIVELFDWIVGSSTGGIIALALVYGNMSVTNLQRLYLRLKRDVFSRSGILQKGNSNQLEWYLQEQLKGTMDTNRMSYPKVLVSAVKQGPTGIKLIFFNNCFEDDYSKEEVWKVARYTSAAPLYFSSKDGYLDGGLLADNPTEDALTAIHNFYRKREMQMPISLVVSLGSGVIPIKNQKAVNVTTDLWNVPSQVFPFLKIVGEALMKPQTDSNSESRCVEQGIRYIRLDPPLEREVDSAETDNDKLVDMLWTTRQYLHSSREDSSGQKKIDAIYEACITKSVDF